MTDSDRYPFDLVSHLLADDGSIPNHPSYPLLLYRNACPAFDGDPLAWEALFRENGWSGTWRNGIYPFHHHHSTAHEVLGICRGCATVQFGGEAGVTVTVQAGDAVAIPAGVGHKNRESSRDLLVIGAYPPGQTWDLCYGRAGERPHALKNIARVPKPQTDPITGRNGPLLATWRCVDDPTHQASL